MPLDSPAILRVEKADRACLAVLRRFVEAQAAQAGLDEEAVDDLVLAADEAATNVIVHGYSDRPGPLEVEVNVEQQAGGKVVRVTLRDRASHFDPCQVPPPDLSQSLSRRKTGGMGIHLMRQCTNSLDYTALEGGNELSMTKKLS